MNKQFKGEIHNWRKVNINHPNSIKDQEHLNYIISGTPVGHPYFVDWINTSAIVKHEDNEVETINSKYKLVGEERINDGRKSF